MPCGKVNHATKEAALKAIDRRINGNQPHANVIRPYRCPWCAAWHVGHGAKKEKPMSTLLEQPDHEERLSRLLDRVRGAMDDGGWHTLEWLAYKCQPGTVPSVSARLRELRGKEGRNVLRRNVGNGHFEYRMEKQ